MKRVLGRLNVSEAYQVGMFRSCAGSGHDLRCRPRGIEIDAHEAVFRANGAQQAGNSNRQTASHHIAGTRTTRFE